MTEIHTPVPITPAEPVPDASAALTAAAAERVLRTLDNSVSPATRKACASDWRSFTAWCEAKGYAHLPATAGTVIAYLAEATAECRRGSIVISPLAPPWGRSSSEHFHIIHNCQRTQRPQQPRQAGPGPPPAVSRLSGLG